jgi:hypothetical protein
MRIGSRNLRHIIWRSIVTRIHVLPQGVTKLRQVECTSDLLMDHRRPRVTDKEAREERGRSDRRQFQVTPPIAVA